MGCISSKPEKIEISQPERHYGILEKTLLVKYTFDGVSRMCPVPASATLRSVIRLLAEHTKAPVTTLWDGDDELDLFNRPFADYFREERRYLAKTLPHGVAPGTFLAELEQDLRGVGVPFGSEAELIHSDFPMREPFRGDTAPTLILAKTFSGAVFGGYSPVRWPKAFWPGSAVPAPGAFAFQLSSWPRRVDCQEICAGGDRDEGGAGPYLQMNINNTGQEYYDYDHGDALDFNGYNKEGGFGKNTMERLERFEFWRLKE